VIAEASRFPSGAMPPAIASRFTTGEAAALAVIAREVQRAGRCELYIDAIAAMAGVCRAIVQNGVREAARLGLVKVTERRIPGRKSLTSSSSDVREMNRSASARRSPMRASSLRRFPSAKAPLRPP
jgi:hypothetical protein